MLCRKENQLFIHHKDTIRRIINETDCLSGKIFAFSIQILIIVSLITFSIDTLPDLSSNAESILYAIEVFTVCVFILEYILRI